MHLSVMMSNQVPELDQDVQRHLRTLIRGLTQNDHVDTYSAYKALDRIGVPALPQLREALLLSNWSRIKYPNEIRYVSGLFHLVHDLDEAVSRDLAVQLRRNGCARPIAQILDSITKFSLTDFYRYRVCGVEVFEHKKLKTRQKVGMKLEQWLRNVPGEDVREIERIYILRKEDLTPAGNYMPILFTINLVWNNPSLRWSPMAWLNNLIIECVLYHEIGHHVHRHTFGQQPEQEVEADRYCRRRIQKNHYLLSGLARILSRPFYRLVRPPVI